MDATEQDTRSSETLPPTRGPVDPAKRIALIGYPAQYFSTFAETLEASGFEVFWVHQLHSEAHFQVKLASTPAHRILDTTEGFKPDLHTFERCREELADLETHGGPLLNDVIMMDRVLRRTDYRFAICYLAHLKRVMTAFFTRHSITLVSSGRDTAAQLVSMLVCRRLGIAWVVPTRVRIPRDMYMFASGHETDSTVPIRPTSAADRAWATEFLEDFTANAPKPGLKAAATGFSDVLRMVPNHARLFRDLLARSVLDRGNHYSRYTIPRIVGMYLRRRVNMLGFKLFPPYAPVGSTPFCIYALHTQPESSIDVAGSFFSDQVALVTLIARSLPASHELYVKIHPTDVDGQPLAFYRTLAAIPGVRLINFNVSSAELMERASLVFVLTGTMGYEGGLRGKNVVTFAKNYYNAMPTVHYCDAPPRLPGLINTLLKSPIPPDWRDRVIAFLADIRARSFNGEVNRMWQSADRSLTADDLRALNVAYAVLHDRLVGRGA